MSEHHGELPLLRPDSAVLEALRSIDQRQSKIAFVTDGRGKLVGSVTDGDIRRGILAGATLQSHVSAIMNTNPISLHEGEAPLAILPLMQARGVTVVPVVDRKGKPLRIVSKDDLLNPQRLNAAVVLMAGGLGSRLKPLTDTVPKPLLPVGGRPLLEITIENLRNQGFSRFYLSVNYRSDMIEEHFGDGSRFGVSIDYLREQERLGTAGALRLLPREPDGPLVVMNGDILTTLDARILLAHHRASGAPATICVREHRWQLPYGVVNSDRNGRFKGLEEKPHRSEMISAGIYVLSPEATRLVPGEGAYDMPTLFETCRTRIKPPGIFLLREYWLDIGHLDDLRRAQDEVDDLFRWAR
jgi:dTDP-glucose pyrophosphorylase